MIAMKQSTQATQRSYSGAIAVEFALVLIPLLLIFAGIIEFGRVMWYSNALAKAVRDGSRLMSTFDTTDIQSAGASAAATRVVAMAGAANIPTGASGGGRLSTSNIDVRCDYAAIDATRNFVTCTNGAVPTFVRVSITGYSITLGSWMPFITRDGVTNYGNVSLNPSMTMRYMN